jgi:hypothetical protein
MPRNHVTHGMSGTRLYRCFRDMKNRCNGLKPRDRENYFERGITYCSEWETFEAFRDWALSNGYNDNLTLDRIDNDKGYSPDNCRWISRAEQNNNTRQNHFITYNGETHTITQWASILGVNASTLRSRLSTYKWSVEDAFNIRILKGGENRCNTLY